MEIEAIPGEVENEVLVKVRMSPGERAIFRDRHEHWQELVDTTLDENQQPRGIILNAHNRHKGLQDILRLTKALTMNPADLREEPESAPPASE